MEPDKMLGHSEVEETSLDIHRGASLVASWSLLLWYLNLNQPIHIPQVDVPLLELVGLMHLLAQEQAMLLLALVVGPPALLVGLKQMLEQAQEH